MDNDWGWYFTSAETRTSMLRDELDAVRSSAGAQTARLSSQLRTLQGSIETRLTALSAAFDAYVELGDLREQLAGFPDTTVIRRDVALAVDALAAGRTAEQVDDRGEVYWLPHAANAVIGVVEGRPDAEAEATARALSSQAELFVVAACGALGRGASVAERVPSLLTCDTGLSADQLALWHGVLAGIFGPVLTPVREVWSPALSAAQAEVGSWRAWTYEQARSRDAEATVSWIAERLEPRPAALPSSLPQAKGGGETGNPPPDRARAAAAELRAVVARLVAQGTDQEAPLIARARVLRERIENPGAAPSVDRSAPADGPTDGAGGLPVVEAVRSALLASPRGSAEETELLSWIAPGLRAAAEAEAGTLAALEPVTQRVRTADGEIEVTSAGAPPDQVQRARQGLAVRYPIASTVPVAAGAAAAVLLVATVIAFVLGSGWAFLLAIVAVAAGVVALRAERDRRERAQTLRSQQDRLDTELSEAQQRVAARIDARETTRTRVSAALGRIRASAGAPEPV